MKKAVAIIVVSVALAGAAFAASLVCIAPTGRKYHYDTCRTLYRTAPTDLRWMSPEEAQRMGYGPCKVCKPY